MFKSLTVQMDASAISMTIQLALYESFCGFHMQVYNHHHLFFVNTIPTWNCAWNPSGRENLSRSDNNDIMESDKKREVFVFLQLIIYEPDAQG